jgi:hypothetical protein
MKVDLNILIPILISILGLIWTYFGAIIIVKERLVRLETKADLFWKPLQDYLVQALHHPNTPSLDRKLENFDNLNVPELIEMKIELRNKVEELKSEKKDNPNILFYVLMLSRVEQVVVEKQMEACRPFASVVTKIFRKVLGRT